ncbi:5'-nucleotidase C-terminal domain-containing protein [Natroniella sp. ANB-PHB2]|uniref:5'-nucleotidase C-terminal domain-containing protein n=1 Tax=Natroniella sp. ANB-PHB2 TaxID=3384444 RepID=UPI0038D3935A
MFSTLDNKRLILLTLMLVTALMVVGCLDDDIVLEPYEISGQVIEAETGEAVEGVTIGFDNIDGSVTTDEEGRWSKTVEDEVTITPVKEGFVFTPNDFTLNSENVASVQEDIVFEMRDENDTFTVAFLHTNDEHGVIENFGKIAWQKQQLEEEYDDVFLVNAGDMFSGTPIIDEYVIDGENLRGKPMAKLMDMVNYDAAVIGNHEFDYGQERLQDSIDSTEHPWLLANMDVDQNVATMEQPEPYVTLETSFGAEVAFLGLVQVGSRGIPATLPDNLYGLEFHDPIDTALDYTHLEDESDIFVGLTHMGHGWEQELAEEMGELDLIIGGHSHTAVNPPAEINDTLVAQAGADTKYLGKVTVTLDASNQVIDRQGELIDIDNIEGTIDEIEEKIAYFEGQGDDIFAREINYLENSIDGNEDLGSLMTDAITESAIVEDAYGANIDFAFQNSGGVRIRSLDVGSLTVGEIFELEPFGNDTIVYEMTADDVRSLVENSFRGEDRIDLRVSGLHYRYIVNDSGEVAGVNLYDYEGNELDEDRVYNVALNNYIASVYEFDAQNDGENTLIRYNDALINFVENDISQEELNTRYQDLERTGIVQK